MRYIFNILILSVLIFSSCKNEQDNVVIYKEFSNNEWSRFDFLSGEFNIKNNNAKYSLTMIVKVNDNYPNAYISNEVDGRLLFNLSIKNFNGEDSRSRDFQFSLKDRDGNWKCTKVDGNYEFRLPLYEELTFGNAGLHTFKLENKYPKDPLQGIEEITLKCVKNY